MAPLLQGAGSARHSLVALLVASATWCPLALREVQVGWQFDNESTQVGSAIRVGALVDACWTFHSPCHGSLDYLMPLFTGVNSLRGGVSIAGELHPLHLEAIDISATEPEEAIRVLVEDKQLRLILGPLDPVISDVASSIVSQAGGVFISPAVKSREAALPGVFNLGFPPARIFGSALRMLVGLGAQSALFIHSDLDEDVAMCGNASSLAASLGMDVEEGPAAQVFSNVAANHVDVIVGCFQNAEECYTAINSLAASNRSHKAVLVHDCLQSSDFLSRTQQNGQFVFGAAVWTSHQSVASLLLDVTQTSQSSFFSQANPDLQGLTAMAAGEVLVTAIEAAGSADPAAVSAAIEAQMFTTLVGSFRFDAFGLAQREAWVLQHQWSRRASIVGPGPLISAQPRYPHPSYAVRACYSDGNMATDSGLSDPNDPLSCSKCLGGHESFTPDGQRFQRCRPCDPGTSSGTLGSCETCLPGTFSAETGRSNCELCAPGRFATSSNSTACHSCPVGHFARREGQKFCEKCAGSGSDYAPRTGMATCEPCPTGALCEPDKNGHFADLTNQEGWWFIKIENGSKSLLRCVHGAGPEGRACQPRGQCISLDGEPLMEGIFCGTCRKDHGRVGAMDVCERCDQVSAGFLTLTAILTCLLVLMTFLSNIVSKTRFKGTRTVVIKQIISYMILVSVAFEYTDHEYPFGIGVGTLVRDLVSVSGLRGGGLVRRAAQCLSWSLFPETQFWKACTICGCIIAPSMVATEIVIFKVLSLLMRLLGKKEPPWRHMVGFVTITLFVLLPRVNGLCLMPMNCFYFDKPRLLTDTEVICNSKGHLIWSVIGYCGFALNSLGIPLILYLMLRFYNSRDMLEERTVINMLGFLYQGFEPHSYYFEVVNMMRNVLVELAVDVPFLHTQTPADMRRLKCATLSILHGLFLIVHLIWQPYDNRSYFLLDRLETASLTATWSTTLLQTWLQVVRTTMRPEDDVGYQALKEVAGWLVALFHLHFWGIILCSILRGIITAILARRQKDDKETEMRRRKKKNCLRRIYKRWMSPGYVVVTGSGFKLRGLSEDAHRLYTIMFAELLDSMTVDGVHDWEMYLLAVQHVCINAYYQRIKSRKSGERPLLNMLNNAQEVVKHFPCGDYLVATLESVKDRIGSKDHEDPEVEHLQYLTEKNIANVIGREFTVEELHCALLRLGSSVREEKLSIEDTARMQTGSKTSLHRLMSIKSRNTKRSMYSDEAFVADDEFSQASGSGIERCISPAAFASSDSRQAGEAGREAGEQPPKQHLLNPQSLVPRNLLGGWVDDRPLRNQTGSRESTFPEPEPMPAADEEGPLSEETPSSQRPPEGRPAGSPEGGSACSSALPSAGKSEQSPPVKEASALSYTSGLPQGKERPPGKEQQLAVDGRKEAKREMYVDMHRLALRADEVYNIFDEPKPEMTRRPPGVVARAGVATASLPALAKEQTSETV